MAPLSEKEDIRLPVCIKEDSLDQKIRENRRIAKSIVDVLEKAVLEKRLTCGLMPAIKQLELDPGRIAFCLLPQNTDSKDTAANHIHKVLLQAFCYEQNITIIQVDRLDVLKRTTKAKDYSCVVVLQPWKNPETSPEKELIHKICNFSSHQITPPIFKLPIK